MVRTAVPVMKKKVTCGPKKKRKYFKILEVMNLFQNLHITSRLCRSITILLQWLVYFLLLWQASCKISDNGLEWLLRFIFQFFLTIGVTCKCEYLCQMAVMFPSSLYLLQKFVKLKRDNFVKFAVCPKCSSLYDLENCTRQVGGRTVSSICTSRPFKRGQKGEC